jgi:MFS family permease
VVSTAVLGATIGATCAGMLADKIGRKNSILLSDALTIIGPLICFFAPLHIAIVCFARFFLGLGLGISMMVS